MKVKCHSCGHIFLPEPRRTVGCLCDSDAPTWIGLTSEGKLITMSYANYEIVKE
jgi:uncharacterized OB-fold protein